MSSDSPATAIGHLKFGIKLSKIIQNFDEQFYKKLKFQNQLVTDLTIFERCTNFKQSYCFIKVHWSITHFSSNNVQMQWKTEGLGQELCFVTNTGLIMINKNEQLPAN